MPPAVAFGVGGLASLGGAVIGSSAASGAAEKQAGAADRASQLQYQMFQQQQQNQQPWQQAGVSALYGPGGLFTRRDGAQNGGAPSLADMGAKKDQFIQGKMAEFNVQKQAALNAIPEQHRAAISNQLDQQYRNQAESDWYSSPDSKIVSGGDDYQVDPELTRSFAQSDFQKDPGYDFRMQEGQKALERSAAARGGLGSGGTLKGLAKYGQDYASNEYNNAYNRFNNDRSNRFNRLSSIAGLGQTANSSMGQASQNYANQQGQNYLGAANSAGAAGLAGASAWNGGLSNLANLGSQYAGLNQQQNWMNQWSNQQRINPFQNPSSSGGSNYNYGGIA